LFRLRWVPNNFFITLDFGRKCCGNAVLQLRFFNRFRDCTKGQDFATFIVRDWYFAQM